MNNPNQKRQWLDPKQPALPVPRRDRFDTKFMLCVWWNYEGIIHFELLENGNTVNAKLYCEQLERMYAALEDRYPALVNRKKVLLQQDNAKPHTAAVTRKKCEELELELLPHPAYSPDLAPSDYHLFRSMAHFLKGRRFENVDDFRNSCQQFFESKDKSWYRRGIEQLAERWVNVIEYDGIYFSE